MPALPQVERHAQNARENVERELPGGDDFVFWHLDLLDCFDWQARAVKELAKDRCPRGPRRVANVICPTQVVRAIRFMTNIFDAGGVIYASKRAGWA